MANEQTSVPLFSVGEVLTSADMNISAGTGVPVFATTVTRDAAFGGAGEKVLAEGQLCYLSDSNIVQQYNGSSWETVGPTAAGGMTLLSTTTLSGASTTISSINQTYTNLYVVCSGMTNATAAGTPNIAPNGSTNLIYGIDNYNSNGTAGDYAYNANKLLGLTNVTRTDANNIWTTTFFNYSSTTTYKTIQSLFDSARDAGGRATGVTTGVFISNTAISSLVFTNPGGNWSTGTVLIYGVK
jgi:hypothetical protein